MRKLEDTFGKGRFVALSLIIGVGQFTYWAWDASQQAKELRDTFCVAVQPYNEAIREADRNGTLGPVTEQGQRLREGFVTMEKRLKCTPDPYDGH